MLMQLTINGFYTNSFFSFSVNGQRVVMNENLFLDFLS